MQIQILAVLPDDFIDHMKNSSPVNDSGSILAKFNYPQDFLLNKTIAQRQCKKFCGLKKNCWGCYHQCKKTCQWVATNNSYDLVEQEKKIEVELSIKPGKK